MCQTLFQQKKGADTPLKKPTIMKYAINIGNF